MNNGRLDRKNTEPVRPCGSGDRGPVSCSGSFVAQVATQRGFLRGATQTIRGPEPATADSDPTPRGSQGQDVGKAAGSSEVTRELGATPQGQSESNQLLDYDPEESDTGLIDILTDQLCEQLKNS